MTRFGVALALSVAFHAPVLGQPTGRIEGRVFDAATGEGLVGGQVRIVETALGNVTRGDGSFFIDAVPVGVRNIETEYLGYRDESRQATILPGRTTRLEFALGGAAIDTPAIVATIASEPWIPSVALPARAVVTPRPARLPDATPVARCEVQAVLHGAYILDGKWQLHTSVGGLRCWSEGDDAGIAPCDQRSPTQHRAALGRGPELTRSTAPDTFHHAPGAQGADLPTPSGPEGSSGT